MPMMMPYHMNQKMTIATVATGESARMVQTRDSNHMAYGGDLVEDPSFIFIEEMSSSGGEVGRDGVARLRRAGCN